MTILLADGTGGLDGMVLLLLLWVAMPLTAVIAGSLAYRGLRSGLDWGWVSLAALVLAAPWLAALRLLGFDVEILAAFPFVLSAIGLVALVNPIAGIVLVLVVLARLANRPSPAHGSTAHPLGPPTKLTLDPRRARWAATAFALAAGIILAVPQQQLDRRTGLALLLFLATTAASTLVVRRPVADTPPRRSDTIS